jgi:hypothetical protein
MADNTKKPSDSDFHKSINESESNTGALSGNVSIEHDNNTFDSTFYVRNSMPAPPNPNKDKGNK